MKAAAGEGLFDLLHCHGVFSKPHVKGLVRGHAANDGKVPVTGARGVETLLHVLRV
jgi:hypothetical protein